MDQLDSLLHNDVEWLRPAQIASSHSALFPFESESMTSASSIVPSPWLDDLWLLNALSLLATTPLRIEELFPP